MLIKPAASAVVTGLVAAVIASAAVAPGAIAQDLRTPDARVPPTPAAHDLRSADARVSDGVTTVAFEPSAPTGFDWVSAAIGAVVGTGSLLLIMAAIALLGIAGRPDRLRPS